MPKKTKNQETEGADVCTVVGISIHASGKSTRGTVTAKPLGKALPGMTLQDVVARVLEDGTWSMTLIPGEYLFAVAGSQYIVRVPAIQTITLDKLVEEFSVQPD